MYHGAACCEEYPDFNYNIGGFLAVCGGYYTEIVVQFRASFSELKKIRNNFKVVDHADLKCQLFMWKKTSKLDWQVDWRWGPYKLYISTSKVVSDTAEHAERVIGSSQFDNPEPYNEPRTQ